jgi:hypothetical protein
MVSRILSYFGLRRFRNQQFSDRERLPLDNFYARYYGSEGIEKSCVLKILRELSEAVEVDAELLRPSDRFTVELRPRQDRWAEIDDSWFSVVMLMKRLNKDVGTNVSVESHPTIDSVIRAYCRAKSW